MELYMNSPESMDYLKFQLVFYKMSEVHFKYGLKKVSLRPHPLVRLNAIFMEKYLSPYRILL